MLRDRLLAGRRDGLDDERLAAEVLGIRGAPAALARKLVAQALVIEDRRDAWRRAGERICADAPATPGVYLLNDEDERVLYVGKAINLRRRLRTHFSGRRWRAAPPELARACGAEWIEVGSELEALLREAALIAERRPAVNVQIGAPAFETRAIPPALVRDLIVVQPSVEEDSVELIAARADGGTTIQRTRRSGVDLAVHARRLWRFFRRRPALRVESSDLRVETSDLRLESSDLRLETTSTFSPIVYSWLAQRGAAATRVDPHDCANARVLQARLASLFRDDRLFHERLEQC